MITMTRGAVIVGLMLAACSDSSSSPSPSRAFDGTWAVCRNDGALDYREVFVVAGKDFAVAQLDYPTTDATCDGDGTPAGEIAATVTYGAEVPAGLGDATVQATQVDVRFTGADTFYTLLYRDAAARPEILYAGNDSGERDGSTPALRPDTLQELRRALQTDPAPADLDGTWSSCTGAGGRVLTFDVAAGTLQASKWEGTCGAGTLVEDLSMTYTLAAHPALAQHGDLTVTALALDLVIVGETPRPVFQTFWVDVAATPWALYPGNDELHGMDGSTVSLRPRVLRTDALAKQPAAR